MNKPIPLRLPHSYRWRIDIVSGVGVRIRGVNEYGVAEVEIDCSLSEAQDLSADLEAARKRALVRSPRFAQDSVDRGPADSGEPCNLSG